MDIFLFFLPGNWSGGRERKTKDRNMKPPLNALFLDIHPLFSNINTTIIHTRLYELLGSWEKKRKTAREMKKAWGSETEMRDGDQKMRQHQMKRCWDEHWRGEKEDTGALVVAARHKSQRHYKSATLWLDDWFLRLQATRAITGADSDVVPAFSLAQWKTKTLDLLELNVVERGKGTWRFVFKYWNEENGNDSSNYS